MQILTLTRVIQPGHIGNQGDQSVNILIRELKDNREAHSAKLLILLIKIDDLMALGILICLERLAVRHPELASVIAANNVVFERCARHYRFDEQINALQDDVDASKQD